MAPEGLWRITLDTNPDDCNLRCIMCEEHSVLRPGGLRAEPHRRMPFALVEKVIREALPLGLREVIPSTMGEPLLWDGLDDLIGLCGTRGLRLNVTTNGTWPGRGPRGWAEVLVRVTSDIKVSWNGATAPTQESIMIGSRFERMVEGVRQLVTARDAHAAAGGNRCKVTLQATFMEANVDQMPALVELAADLGADRVKGHHVWTHWPRLEPASLRRSSGAQARWNDAAAKAHEAAARRGVALENFEPLSAFGGAEVPTDLACPFLGREAWIAADGRFSPCCAPDDRRRTLGDFGNLTERSLAETLASAEYRGLVEGYRSRPLCRVCPLRRRCS